MFSMWMSLLFCSREFSEGVRSLFNSALGSKSRSLLATAVAASTSFSDTHRLCSDALQIQLIIPVSRWHKRSQQFSRAVIRPVRFLFHRRYNRMTHRASSVWGLRGRPIRRHWHLASVLTATLISSKWSISLHGTTAVRVALSGR